MVTTLFIAMVNQFVEPAKKTIPCVLTVELDRATAQLNFFLGEKNERLFSLDMEANNTSARPNKESHP